MSLEVAMDLPKTVGGEDQLYKALSTMDLMVVGLMEGQMALQMAGVKSPFSGSNNKSRSGSPRTLTMTSKQRSTSLELAQITPTMLAGKSKRYLGPYSATRQSKSQMCLSGVMKRRMNSVTMSMRTSRLTRQMNIGVSMNRWISSRNLPPRSTTSSRLLRTIVRVIDNERLH